VTFNELVRRLESNGFTLIKENGPSGITAKTGGNG
jgi:hypothetical protein